MKFVTQIIYDYIIREQKNKYCDTELRNGGMYFESIMPILTLILRHAECLYALYRYHMSI